MITNLLLLSKINYTILISKRGFVFATLLLITTGLFIIPKQNADYVTFYVGNYTGYPSALWVGSLGAILGNLIISFIGFFFLEGLHKEEVNNGIGVQTRSSRCSNFLLFFFKWLSYIFLLFTFLGILIITLYLVNAKDFNLFVFLKPFLFYSVPYLIILAFIVLFLDYIILSRGLRITIFIILIIFSITPFAGKYFDLMGINNFSDQVIHQVNLEGLNKVTSYGLGYMKKSNIGYLKIDVSDGLISSLYYRIMLVICAFGALFFSSFLFKRYFYSSFSKAIPEAVSSENEVVIFNHSTHNWENQRILFEKKSLFSLILAEFRLFKLCFPKLRLAILILLLIPSFTLGYSSASRILVPLIFILSFPLLEDYINLLNVTNLYNYYKTSVFTSIEKGGAKLLIINSYYTILLTPVLIYNGIAQNFITLLYLFSLTSLALLSAKYLHNIKLVEIVYIIIFGSYLAGSPVIKIF